MDFLLDPQNWIALLTLTFLEIVLGIDNIIFISIITNKLPSASQKATRNTGLLFAMIFRVLLLLTISFFIRLTNPLFSMFSIDFSIRDLVLIAGGIFLIIKSISEIHQKMEGDEQVIQVKSKNNIMAVVFQIILIDMIFSFDSILTAIGLSNQIPLMITAIIISILIMMLFAGAVGKFINKHPTLQVLALSFLILIGFMLVIDGFHYHVPKGYLYFAVFFSLLVEILNMQIRKKSKPVHLHDTYKSDKEQSKNQN
jgi:predicted tellurium resistance membrane protein TerC